MRPIARLSLFATALACAGVAWAQTPPPKPAPSATPAPAPAPAAADPVVARVGSTEIRLSDVNDAASGLPDQYRSMPMNVLFPLLLDQLIDRQAIVMLAQKQGLDQDPAVKRQMADASNQALQTALLSRTITPQVTEEAIRARYDHEMAGKPGEEEVHARHILVASEADALKIIADLKAGGDFVAIAKARSTDPGAADGGDLGFFKKGDLMPEVADAAFAMKPGQISDKPVHTQYGWHVIKVEERRAAPPPTFEQAHDELRQKMIQEDIQALLVKARAGVQVQKFNADGSVPRPTDTAQPPPSPPKK